MAIKLKTKVALGGIFLFALLLLVGIVSFIYFNLITHEAKDVLKDNYETLNYTRQMLRELDELKTADSTTALASFEQNLQQQEKNITEPGEKELTQSLRSAFEKVKRTRKADTLNAVIRKDIGGIMQVNLQAIDKKNQAAQVSAQKAKTIITIILTICVLIGFTFIFNFPSLIASPIAALMEGIKAIAQKNYRQRIHLNRTDEFGDLANAFNSMAEQLDKYEHSNLSRILFEKQRAETVINSLKDASIGIDTKGLILFANHQALQLLNLKEADIVGLPQNMIQERNDLFRFLINEQQDNIPFKIVVEGKENYFTKEMVEINQDREKIGSVIVLKNITPFKELDTAKTNFIATISHELKTPLASSDFSLKLLEDERVGKLTPEQKELVQSLKNDNQRLLRILSELLDMSQVESGKIRLNIQEVSLQDIITRAINSVDNTAREKNITIKKETNGNATVRADEEKATWVLNNFLTNAIKYSPENGTIILKTTQKDGFTEIGVRDSGIGIDNSFQARIFDRYFKVPGIKERKGTGLGLAISKDFVEAMNGKIGVESQPGKGSYFFFQLPVGS